jgi:hypothetical protein
MLMMMMPLDVGRDLTYRAGPARDLVVRILM